MVFPKALYPVVFAAFISGCGVLSSRPAPVAPRNAVPPAALPATPQPVPQAGARSEALIQAIVALGSDYRYGGASHAQGFDCSGLVAHVYRTALGVALPRTVLGQSTSGESVALADLAPGDLVFYNTLNRPWSHVGIYLGDGKFIHAPKTGAQVRTENMRNRYWERRFNGARRISSAAQRF